MARSLTGPLAAYLDVRASNEESDRKELATLGALLQRKDALQFRREDLAQRATDRDEARTLARESRDLNLQFQREGRERAFEQRQQQMDTNNRFMELKIAAIGDERERKIEQSRYERQRDADMMAFRREVAAARAGDGEPTKALPSPLMKDLIEKGQILDASERYTKTFKDDYAGYGSDALGNAALMAERKNPLSTRTDRTQWWQDYELHQSVVRNKLFGSALTAPEIAAWERSAVTPGMKPADIKVNLARREQIEREGTTRLARSAATQYNRNAIREALGRDIPDLTPPPAPAPAAAPTGTLGGPGWSIRPAQ